LGHHAAAEKNNITVALCNILMFTTRISRIVQYFPFNTESGKLLRAQWPKNPGSPTLYQSLDLLPGSFCCQVTYMNGKVLPVMAAWHANKQVVALAMVALDHLLSRTVTWVVLGICFVQKQRNQTPVVA